MLRAREIAIALPALACGRLEFTPSEAPSARGDGATIPACAGHDEDGDGVGDACDRCPTVPDPGQEDRGELDAGASPDGVGDACDPRPSLGGDRIALFESYAQPPQVALVSFGSVMWDGSDALRLAGAGVTGQARFSSVVRFTRAELRYRITTVTPTSLAYVGLWTHVNGMLEDSVYPHVADQTGDGDPANFKIKESIPIDVPNQHRYSPTIRIARELAAGDEIRTVHDTDLVTGGPQRFSVDVLTTGEQLSTELVVTRPFTGEYVLESVDYGVEVASLLLYDVP